MKAISLFSCGGIGDLGLHHAGFDVLVANELQEERAEVFKFNYPNIQMITGDIWQKQQDILAQTKQVLNGKQLDLVFATPPCQGMSKNGRGKLLNAIRQGLKPETDERNLLIIPTLTIFLASGAHTLVLENVPEMENTYIPNPHQNGEMIGIIDFIKQSLGSEFLNSIHVVEFADYGVPQCRQRLISIFTKHDKLKKHLQLFGSLFPDKTHSKEDKQLLPWQTVSDAIAHLPTLDARQTETAKHKFIPYHSVPLLDEEKYFWVSNTPKEKSAFDNQCINPSCRFDKNPTHGASVDEKGINRYNTETPLFCIKCGQLLPRPWVKENGQYRLMKGYTSAYKRMSWDSPASTLTRNLSYACSDNKVHPEQNRVLSLYEAMILHTITDYEFYWQRADGKKISDKLIRELIGESIPPAGLEKIFCHLAQILQRIDLPVKPKLGQQELAVA
jgi:DNA (cytosine-5)-methyltransferase 1